MAWIGNSWGARVMSQRAGTAEAEIKACSRHHALRVGHSQWPSAARLFEKHPHFMIFPGESVEIMPVLPIPGV
jgi:hypothetical protein